MRVSVYPVRKKALPELSNGVYEQVKRALQDIVAPELKVLQVEIKRLDEKTDLVRNELKGEAPRVYALGYGVSCALCAGGLCPNAGAKLGL